MTKARDKGPTISVIVPAFNAAKFLGATLESALNQTRDDIEVIVVDDGSTDSTFQIAQDAATRDKRIRLVRKQNGGLSSARNAGLAAMSDTVKAVKFLDADDLMDADALELLASTMEQDPACVGAHGLARYIDSKGSPVRSGEAEYWTEHRYRVERRNLVPVPLSDPTTFEALVVENYIFVLAILIRRSVIDSVGVWDLTRRITEPCDDWDMWLRAASRGRIAFVPTVVGSYRLHGTNMSANMALMARSMQAVRERMQTSPLLTPEQRSLAKAGAQFAHLVSSRRGFAWARESLRRGDIRTALQQLRTATFHRLAFQTGAT